ncbi:hypothetical protein [Herpetosiphon sp.]|uniref:hypothetical protein n=1 Tax=Herpetosiphon sp. TaxID=71864 RepID=UPI000310350F|nr:hypothetical protein [Herpetosiphon sp.]
MGKTKQDELIGLVEDATALNNEIGDAHKHIALRANSMSRESLDELRHAEQSRRKQQGVLHTIRQLVAKRATDSSDDGK